MPFINGRYYMNPFYGRALEKARMAAEGRVWSEDSPELEVLPVRDEDFREDYWKDEPSSGTQRQQDSDAHWVTIDHRHVLIREEQGKSKRLPSSGQGSIYSDSFEGKKTANGETFRQNGYTAALLPRTRWHAVPLGTRVKLTHSDNSVVVEINDRGAGDRDPQSIRALDLSRAAASALTGQRVEDDGDAKRVGLIRLDKIEVVPKSTPLGPVRR